jgi:hypothetical protein
VVLAIAGCGSVEPSTPIDGSVTDAVDSCSDGCDDQVACTVDACVTTCQHTPDDAVCATGYGCDPVDGCVPRYGRSQDRPGTSCADILRVLVTAGDGAYWIDPDGGAVDNSFEVYCDMTTEGGGWTLVYEYVGTGPYSQEDLFADDFAGPTAPIKPLAGEQVDAIHQRAYEAFWTAKGRTWMSTWVLFDGVDHSEIDRNHALFSLDDQLAWSDVAFFDHPDCQPLPGKVSVQVFDDATRALVAVGSSSYRYVASPLGFGFLAADATQTAYGNLCGQAADNVLHWPAGVLFDTTLNLTWADVMPHLWYVRNARDVNKDRCSWKCWNGELLYGGREWYVR